MKAARIHAYGHSDQVQVEDVSIPQIGDDDVLVRISAAGINPVDWKVREGMLARSAPRTFPFTLGQDFSGEVIAVGDAVTDIEASESVYGFANGTYAEYAVVSPELISSKPITVTDAIAAGLPTPGLTALQIVRDVVTPAAGQTILIHGAAGGGGAIATQLCVARGARVFATASSKDAGYLRQLGVAGVIDYQHERFENGVHGADAAIDLVGGDTLQRSFAVVRRGGLIVSTVGPVDPGAAERAGVRAVQFWMQKRASDLEELAELVDAGTIRPRDSRILPLARARDAQDLNQQHRTSQKVVLAPG